MKKKLIVACIAFLSTMSVVFAVHHELSANTSVYNAGGNITGRVNRNPNNLTINGLGLQKGDKVLFGANNLSWILMYPQTYNDYENTGTNDSDGWPIAVTTNPSVTAWLAMTSSSLGNMALSDTDFTTYSAATVTGTEGYKTSKVAQKIADLNSSFLTIDNYQQIVAPRNLGLPRTACYTTGSSKNIPNVTNYYSSKYETFYTNEHGKKAFTPGYWSLTRLADNNYNGYDTKRADFAFSDKYWSTDYAISGSTISWYGFESGGNLTYGSGAGYKTARETRAAIWFDLSKSVFAISKGDKEGLANVNVPNLANSYVSLYTEAMKYNDMKVRLESSALTATTNLTHIENKQGDKINKITEGAKIYLQADAEIGNDGKGGVNTVSVLIFDESNNFVYYKPLEPAKGNGLYEFDTTDMAVGKYKIGIVNEVYNENSTAPANSSAISDVKELEIVDPLSIEYETVYEGKNADGSARTTHEYTKNVDAGNTIGQIKYKDGVSPYTFTLSQHPSDADSYKNFEIDTLDIDGKTTASSSSPLSVKIKSNASDLNTDTGSLKAGTYKFCITAKDVNGDPVDADGNLTQKVCTSITVNKTTPTLELNDKDNVNMKIGSAAYEGVITTSNKDIGKTKSSSSDIWKPTYEIKNGVPNILKAVEVTGTDAYGYKLDFVASPDTTALPQTFDFFASLPETENYLAVSKDADGNSITKKVTVYKELSGLTWSGKSSYSVDDVKSGNKVGELLAKDGLSKFTYALATSADAGITGADGSAYNASDAEHNANFTIDPTPLDKTTKAEVKTNTNLIKKQEGYKVQFKVTDSNNDVVFVSATIVVNAQSQGAVKFKDTNGNIITSMDIYYDDKGVNVKSINAFVDGDKPAGGSITYKPAPSSDQPGGITATDYLVVNENSGELEPKKVGSVLVYAISKGDSTYADAKGTITINIKPATRTITFDTVGTERKIQKDATNITEPVSISKSAGNTDSITYESSNTAVFTVDNSGNITIVGVGNAKLTAKVVDSDGQYIDATCEKNIIIYDGASGNFSQTTNPQAGTESANINKPVGGVHATGGIGTISYKMNTTYTGNNIDGALFKVDEAWGTLSFNAAITASDLVGKYNTTKKAYILKAQVNVLDDGVLSSTVDCEISIKGEALTNVKFDGEVNGTLTHTYSKNGSFTLSLVGNDGKGLPAYSIKNDPNGMSDVIKAITGNTAFIENANDPDTSLNKPIIIAKIPPAGGYDEAEIEVEVSIVKAKQANFAFVQNEISILPGGKVTPTFKGAETNGAIKLVSQNTGFVTIGNDNTIKGEAIGKAEVIASIEGDRNYEPGSAKATVTVTDKPSYVFIISVPSATYGDTGLQASIVKSEHTSGATLTKKWESSDPTVATINETTGEITIVGAGETIISCTQTSTLDDTVKTSGTLNVKKRPISIAYENKEIYVGEGMPSFTLDSTLQNGTLVNGDTISSFPIPAGATSTAVDTLMKGEYTISGSYDTNESKEAVIKNYAVTFVDGTLTIKQDTPKENWYELQDDAGNVLSSDNWYNHDVNVVLKNATGDAGTYDQISDTTLFNNSDLTKYKVNKEDDNLKDVYFRIDPASAVDHAGAISEKTQTHVKIDKTPPIITSLTGEEVNQNLLARVVNTITFGRYMKPGTQVEVKANDQPKGQSVISGLKEIEYTIYSVDEDGNVDIQNPYDTDTINASETTKLPILSNGKYEVCAIAKDHAGNPSQEKCTELWLKPIGEDSDGDGIPDINIDTDGDSIPDLNITKNPGDKIPWLNIDTNGDGKPDMNIDLDGDGIPDLNTGIITKWVCDKMGDMDDDGDPDYKTSSTVKGINNIDTNGNNIPDLNIDLDLDGLPELNINIDGDLKQAQTNIDGNGGGKANINIDTNGDGTPEQNVISVPEWNPDHKVYKDGKIIYETMDLEFKPIEELEDNGVVVKPKDEHVSISPDMKLDVNNITSSTSEAEKEEIRLRSGLKNSEVKQVYNVNLLEENKIIQPNGKVEVKIPIDTSIKNPRIMMKAKDGTWQMMEAKAEGNYYVFETDYIGDVSVLGDQEATANDPTNNDDKTEDPKDDTKTPTPTDTSKNPDTSVKGTYTKGTNTIGMGGALTGDSSNPMFYILCCIVSLSMMMIYRKRKIK